MDLKVYYQKIREIEERLTEDHVVVVSRETPDGGKAGVRSEVPKKIAARMVVNGGAALATEEEAKAFRKLAAEAKRTAELLAESSRVQLSVVPTSELNQLRNKAKGEKN